MIIEEQLSKNQADKVTQQRPFCLFLNTYYDRFLNSHYSKNPQLMSAPCKQQLDSLQAEFFGDSDFYSEGLKKADWDAENLVLNCSQLQRAWAKENNFSGDGLEIAIEQIRRKRPQVVYLQDLSIGTKDFLSAIRPYTELIVGQKRSQRGENHASEHFWPAALASNFSLGLITTWLFG